MLPAQLARLFREAIEWSRATRASAPQARDIRQQADELKQQDPVGNAERATELRRQASEMELASWPDFRQFRNVLEKIKDHLIGPEQGESIRQRLNEIRYSTFGGSPRPGDEDGRDRGLLRFEELANALLSAPQKQRGSSPEDQHIDRPLGKKSWDYTEYMAKGDLTERQRECYSLRFEYGLSESEIARRLKIHRSTVQQHIGRADVILKTADGKAKAQRHGAHYSRSD